jgi:hypothetical protein
MLSDTELTDRIRGLAPTRDDADWTEVVARAAVVDAPPSDLGRTIGARLRRPITVALAGAVLIAAIALIPTWLGGGERVSLVDRALAAVSGGPVLHAVLAIETEKMMIAADGEARHLSVVDLATGRERTVETRIELWYDPDRKLLRQIVSIDGAVRWDVLHSPQKREDSRGRVSPADGPPMIDPALAAFFRGYRQALADGSATRVGSDFVDGRRVEWLRFPVPGGENVSQEVALAANSEDALYLRTVCSHCAAKPPTYRIATLEGVSVEAANFSVPRAPEGSGKGRYANGGRRTIALEEADSLLGQTALWAGRKVGGADFSLAQYVYGSRHTSLPTTKENEVGRGHGLLFLYGVEVEKNGGWRVSPGKPNLSITETADYRFGPGNFDNGDADRPLTLAGGPVPPAGEVALSSGGPNGGWSGQLEKNGLYVEIQASSRELVLAAARALEPVR